MSDNLQEYSDWISLLNARIQARAGYLFGLVGFILLSPILLFKGVTIDHIFRWLKLASDIAFRGLPIFFLPFFALHEALHIVFMAIALIHPKITFEKWLMPTFHTRETFSMGMVLVIPDKHERSPLISMLAILICMAPILGFIPTVWAITKTSNPFFLVYLILGWLWLIPSDSDRKAIREGIALLLKI